MDSLTLSPLGLFLQAGPVGRSVMIVLLIASIGGWLVILEGLFGLMRLSRALRDPQSPLLAGVDDLGQREAHERIAGETVSERRARVAETMTRGSLSILMKAEGGSRTSPLIPSVAPFIGLFGTVWGIMASFVGIAAAKDTSLAVVAPGIAEALAATAYGLAAAIPASIGYNRLGPRFLPWPAAGASRRRPRRRILQASGLRRVMGFSVPEARPGWLSSQADINVTPLVDVMLGAADHLHGDGALDVCGVKVDLPQAKASQQLNPKEPIVVIIGKDGQVALGGETVDRADIAARVKLQIGDDAERIVHSRATRTRHSARSSR